MNHHFLSDSEHTRRGRQTRKARPLRRPVTPRLECLEDLTLLTTFSDFALTGGQAFVFTNTGQGSTFKATSVPVQFEFDNISGVPTGYQSATLTLTSTAVTPAQVVLGQAVQPIDGTTNTLTIRRNSDGANLLSATFTGFLGGTPGSVNATLTSDTASGNALSFTSDFLSFAGVGNRDMGLFLPNLSPPLSQNANGYLDTFASDALASFASDTLPVASLATTTTLAAAPNPSTLGQAVTFTAHVTSNVATPLTPGGTVAFEDTTTGTPLGTVALSGAQAMLSTAALGVGGHIVTATYSGDSNFAASHDQVTQVVQQAATTTTLAAAPNPSTLGQTVTFTAHVAPDVTTPLTPGGSVAFEDTTTGTPLGTVALSGGQAMLSTAALGVGGHIVTATYSGDSNFTASHDQVTQVVQQAATTTTLSAAPNPSTLGQTVTFTAHVTSNVATPLTPGGSVMFEDTTTGTPLGTVALSGAQAMLSTAALGVGGHIVTATYSGDSNFTASHDQVTQVVQQAATTTTLSAAPNPSTLGQTVTFTAHVTSNVATPLTPGGSVMFEDTTTGTPLGTVALSGGQAMLSTAALGVGGHIVTATYSGDSNFTASHDQVTQVVQQAATTTTLSAAPNPSTLGQTVTFTAHVAPDVTTPLTPGGSVAFEDTTTGTPLGTVALSGGQAMLSTAALGVGGHVVTATYSGDSNFAASHDQVTQVVQQAATTTTLSAAPNPSTLGQAVTFTAQVAPDVATGLSLGGAVGFVDTTTGDILGMVPVSGGQAVLNTSALALGTHLVVAVYSGDANLQGSTSGAVVQTVNLAPVEVGPQVVAVQRFGFHMRPTSIVLTFSQPLDLMRALEVHNYEILGPAGRSIGLRSIDYVPGYQSVVLHPSVRLNIHRTYTLVAVGTAPGGITNTTGTFLNAYGPGQPGQNFVTSVNIRTLVTNPASFEPPLIRSLPSFSRGLVASARHR